MYNIHISKDDLILWFIKEKGMTPDEAIDYIKTFPTYAILTYKKVERDKLKKEKKNENNINRK